mmetsp:Transcript_91134/g.162236  ORF Transcript_91134/g.162236 Transcript_91134/m.162236 type:complete len:719 (+) Transcript_91134:41-2197(+)
MCTEDELEKGSCSWTLPVDVGLPAKQLFNIVVASVVFLSLASVIHVVFLIKQIQPPNAADPLVRRFGKSKGVWFRLLFLILAIAWGTPNLEASCEAESCGNWRLMFWYGLALILSSNVASRAAEFYLGQGPSLLQQGRFFLLGQALPSTDALESVVKEGGMEEDGNVGFWTLMPSVFITWIFAKSIFNSAILGGMYGLWGGLAYASWYVSFFSAGTLCYILRTKYGHRSFMMAIYKSYGSSGTICYMFAIMFRLFNEIWSNATVIGSFYGAPGSKDYWGACWLSTLIPAVYVFMGGMRASLFSDTVQAFIAVAFMLVVLSTIQADSTFANSTSIFTYQPQDGWYDDGWWACFWGGILQGLVSYPFFDPVLTDRGFLSTPKTMLLSFCAGGVVAALFIVFYAAIGVYGTFYHEYWAEVCSCDGAATVSQGCPTTWNPCARLDSSNGDSSFAAWVLGHQTYAAVEVFVTFVMITASMSTLDSTFTSWSKFVSLELGGWLKLRGDHRGFLGPLEACDLKNVSSSHLLMARCSIVLLMVLGVAFLGTEKDAMKATSAAGTMVMGIGPPIWMMTIWKTKNERHKGWVQAPLAFVLPSAVGFVLGYFYYSDGKEGEGLTYDSFKIGDVYYSRFLGTNVWGHLICFVTFVLCFAFHQLLPNAWFYQLPQVDVSQSQIGIALPVPKDPSLAGTKEPSMATSQDVSPVPAVEDTGVPGPDSNGKISL